MCSYAVDIYYATCVTLIAEKLYIKIGELNIQKQFLKSVHFDIKSSS